MSVPDRSDSELPIVGGQQGSRQPPAFYLPLSNVMVVGVVAFLCGMAGAYTGAQLSNNALPKAAVVSADMSSSTNLQELRVSPECQQALDLVRFMQKTSRDPAEKGEIISTGLGICDEEFASDEKFAPYEINLKFDFEEHAKKKEIEDALALAMFKKYQKRNAAAGASP